MSKLLVAMSGGVDSSVSAALMVRQGHECIGVNMKLHNGTVEDDIGTKTCCSLTDAEDTRRVCYRLGMKFHVFNFTGDFEKEVIGRFVCAYECGATPNPCIDCNKYMKFSRLYDRAQILGCDTIVTGHYARIEWSEERNRWLLKKAKNVLLLVLTLMLVFCNVGGAMAEKAPEKLCPRWGKICLICCWSFNMRTSWRKAITDGKKNLRI